MFAAACFVASSGVALAASPTFTTIDNPGDPTFNQLLAISNTGIIAGYFGSGQAGHPNQAYTIQPPYTSFSRFVVPGAVQTQATALFDTTTVGFWSGTNMGMLNGAPQDANYGFVREKLPSGQYQWILVNDKTSSFPAMANLLGINGAMNAVGFYADSNGLSHGFAYNVTTGVYTAVTISGAKQVAATGINASNLIAGFYVDGAQVTHAFLASLSGGAPIRFTVPGAQVTQFFGVNDSGEAVGSYTLDGVIHGLLYNPANGLWQTLDYPNAVEAPGSGTVINGLNNKGQAVGFYNDAAGNTHGMLINNAF
jgi:hypothetical protein